MPDIDWMKIGVSLAVFGMLVTLFGTVIVGWHSMASRNLVLACAALVGTVMFSVVQGALELRQTRARDAISGSFALTPAESAIRHVRKPQSLNRSYDEVAVNAMRTIPEGEANGILAALVPRPRFESGEPKTLRQTFKIITDFALFSLLHYIKIRQPDWQASYTVVRTSYMGTSVLQPTASFAGRHCTDFTKQAIQSLLHEGQSVFSEAPLKEFANNPMCLPPQSTMMLGADFLRILNPFLETTFNVRVDGGGGGTMLFHFDVVTVYSGLRAQHHAMPDYRQWVNRLIADARQWFEG